MPGHPSELLACRYHGLNQPQPAGTLATSAHFAAGPIAAALNSGRPVPKGKAFRCPADFRETMVLQFGYPDGTNLTATVSTAGCTFANNGDLTVWPPIATLTTLKSVLGHDDA